MSAVLLLSWLGNYLLHSTLLLGTAWALDRPRRGWSLAAREWLWRVALFGGLLTASVAMLRPALPSLAMPSLIPQPVDDVSGPRTGVDAVAQGSRGLRHSAASMDAGPTSGIATHVQRDAATTTVTRSVIPQHAASAPVPAQLRLSARQSAALIGVWLSIATLGLALLLRGWLRLRAELRRAPDLPADALPMPPGARRHSRKTRLYLSSQPSPVAGPGAQIGLPAWALDCPPEQQQALLAHELAHLQRGDPHWRLAIAISRRLFWLQPLQALAATRLDALAELACDRQATTDLGGDRHALAHSLLRCAKVVQGWSAPVFSPAMATRRSPLVIRMKSLLEPDAMSNRKPRTLAVIAGTTLLLGGCLLLPTFSVLASGRTGTHISIHQEGDDSSSEMTVSISRDGRSLDAYFDGKPTFNADDTDLVSLTGGGTGWIEEVHEGVKRRVDFTAAGGAISRRYRVDGTDQPLDAAGQQWLGEAILTMLRETGVDAEGRVTRLLGRGGPDAVFADIQQMSAGHGRRVYLVELARQAQLDPAQLKRYLEEAIVLDGDYERRGALVAIVDSQTLDAPTLAALLDASAGIGSDYEKRQLLQALTPKLDLRQPSVAKTWERAVSTIRSDYERRQVIEQVTAADTLSPAALDAVLGAIDGIESDYESRVALTGLAPRLSASPQLLTRYVESSRTIGSDYEQRQALDAVLGVDGLPQSIYPALLAACADIGSDYERRELMVHIARQMPADPQLIAQYRQLSASLSSYERSQAEQALQRMVL